MCHVFFVSGQKRRFLPTKGGTSNFMVGPPRLERGTSCMSSKHSNQLSYEPTIIFLEATPGFEPGIKVLQTSALPLGYVAINMAVGQCMIIIAEVISRSKQMAFFVAEMEL
jgi:hypothetical protein